MFLLLPNKIGKHFNVLLSLKFFEIVAEISSRTNHLQTFLFLSFRRVLNVICSFLGNFPAFEF